MDQGSRVTLTDSVLRNNSATATGKCFKFVDDVVRCPIAREYTLRVCVCVCVYLSHCVRLTVFVRVCVCLLLSLSVSFLFDSLCYPLSLYLSASHTEGGAIAAVSSAVSAAGCVLELNRGLCAASRLCRISGGAVAVSGASATVRLAQSQCRRNSVVCSEDGETCFSGSGAGVYGDAGEVEVTGSEVTENEARGGGGGGGLYLSGMCEGHTTDGQKETDTDRQTETGRESERERGT